MEEEEQSVKSKEDGLKNGTDPPEEFKVVVEVKEDLVDLKDVEDGKNLKEVKDREERKNVEEIKNGEEDKDVGETKVVFGKEARKAVDAGEKEAGDSLDIGEKKNLEEIEGEEKKKEDEVQNGDEMKFVAEGKDGEENRVLGRKSEEEGSNPIDDISVKELKNGEDEEGVEEIKDDEHSKTTSGEKDEESVLVQVEENEGGKARKEAEDIEMVGAEDVVEKEAGDVKDEGKLVVREGEEEKEDNGGNADKTVGDNQKIESLKRKRSRGRRLSETGEAKKNGDSKENVEEEEVKGSGKRSKEVLSTPVVSSSERPVRERKTVERLVEVIEKGPDSTVIIEKGRGIPLIEIPNVAYNFTRKKPAELKFLHQTIFGRKGKAVNFRSNLLQFSGFAWHESEEKQRAKIKEKLDKGVKETLLDLCDLFDLTVSKTNTKKDEIIVKLLDFLEAPQAMSDVIHAEEQSSKSRKRERAPKVDASKTSGGNFEKRSRQKHEKAEGTPNSEVKSSHDTEDGDDDEHSEEDEDEDSENEVPSHSESDAEEKKLEETGDEEKDQSEVDADLTKGKQVQKSPKSKEKLDVTKSPKKQVSSHTVKKVGSNSKKTTPKTDGKSTLKTPPSKHPKAEKSDDTGEKVFSRKKKDDESPKKSNSKSNLKEKSSGKASKSKAKSRKEQKSGPNKAELRKSICEILKEADFNTATFTDILKQLASQYKIDLTPRKAAIKLLIQEELTKLADEAEDSQDEEEMQ